METARVREGRRRSPGLLAAVALALWSVSTPAQTEALPTLPLSGVVISSQASLETSAFTIELPQGARLVLKARGESSAPALTLLGPDGQALSLEPSSRGRMTTLKGFLADSTGTHTLLLTDSAVGGQLLLRTRTTWPIRRTATLVNGLASVPLFSPGEVPVTLTIRAPKDSLEGGLSLQGLTGADGQPIELEPNDWRVSLNGRVLRIGPMILPAGPSQALVAGVPVPGTPVPDLEIREHMRFQRAARLK
jgi:hypothetical protein